MTYLLSIDQGTTSSRATIFSTEGFAVATASRPLTQYYPTPGCVEHDPREIWEGQLACIQEVLSLSGVSPSAIAGMGITNQRETTILWERSSGKALHPAIVWQDRRTASVTERLKKEGVEEMVRERTGLVLDPYFSATKLSWLLDHIDGARAKAERGDLCFGTVDSWLMFCLTGGRSHVTDVSNASRTMLFNIRTLQWDDELLRLFGIPSAILPEVLGSAGRFGNCLEEVTGAGIPVTGVAGDQQAALFGQGCFAPGMAKATFGTGSFVVMNSGDKVGSGEGVLATIAWQLPGETVQYALEGSIFIAGAAVQWLQEGLGLIQGAGEVEALARTVPDTGGIYFVPALSGLGTPYWDPYARGVIAGLTRGSCKAHLARAALEAIAFQTVDAIRSMECASGLSLRELRVDGGATRNDLLLEIQADLLGAPVLRPACTESTSLGAACLAGIGAGVLDRETISRQWSLDRRFDPCMGEERRAELYRGWQRCVQLSLGWDRV